MSTNDIEVTFPDGGVYGAVYTDLDGSEEYDPWEWTVVKSSPNDKKNLAIIYKDGRSWGYGIRGVGAGVPFVLYFLYEMIRDHDVKVRFDIDEIYKRVEELIQIARDQGAVL
jgi:hypothetical protein